MQAASDIQGLQQELKELLTDGIGVVLQALKEKLPPNGARYNEVIQLEGRLKEANVQSRQGILSYEQLQLAYARLRQDVLALIDDLQAADFQVQAVPASAKTSKRGSILYRIPTQMQLERETRCLVRLAFLEEYLLENIELDADTKIQSIRIADVMGVQLLDPNEQQAFAIRLLTEAEQFVDEDDYSEWIFNVRPLLEGVFSLMLKVTVIEEKRGKERKRDIVLEETIEIVTTTPATDEPFKTADYHIQFGESQGKKSATVTGKIRRLTGVMAGVLFMVIGSWAIDVPQIIAWQQTKGSASVAEYERYLQQYPGGRHVEEALWSIAALEEEEGAYEDYLELFPNGLHQQEAEAALAKIRAQQMERLQNPVPPTQEGNLAEQNVPPQEEELLAQEEIRPANPSEQDNSSKQDNLNAETGNTNVPKAATPQFEQLPIKEADEEQYLTETSDLNDTSANFGLENGAGTAIDSLTAKTEANADYQYLDNRTTTILRAYRIARQDYLRTNPTLTPPIKARLNQANQQIEAAYMPFKDCMIRQFKDYIANDRNYDELLRTNTFLLDYMDSKLTRYQQFYEKPMFEEDWQDAFDATLAGMEKQVEFLQDKTRRMGCATD